ncbi:MAG: DUF444 family protein [Deltaproteobacteria bacterium]|nr:DUF444 family protein [Deltaproteobacteria bacterium]
MIDDTAKFDVVSNIEKDHARFREIIRGKIKSDLKKYITKGELIGKKGEEIVSIPIPQIDIPHFRFGGKQTGGVGQGDGNPGDPIGAEEGEGGTGKAGDAPGEHILEVELTIEELAEIMGEALELPRIRPKGSDTMETTQTKYTGIHKVGPRSLRHFRRSFKQALRRTISSGIYDPENPVVIPINEDLRFRSWKELPVKKSNAVVFYMMDVSGSMGDDQKEIVRIESFWIDTYLRAQYQGIETRYIIHDAMAHLVDRETFFHTRESGGTMISSAYRMCGDAIKDKFPESEWNIYLFHFSDGDNWSSEDTQLCVSILRDELLPQSNLFCYGQVESPYGSGQFIKDLREAFPENELTVFSEIKGKENIVDSIVEFLGKGR